MNIVFGILIGIAIGTLQLYLLVKFIKGVTAAAASEAGSDSANLTGHMAIGMLQLLLPFAALLIVAFVYRAALLWAGIGAGTSLIVLGVIKTLCGKKEG